MVLPEAVAYPTRPERVTLLQPKGAWEQVEWAAGIIEGVLGWSG